MEAINIWCKMKDESTKNHESLLSSPGFALAGCCWLLFVGGGGGWLPILRGVPSHGVPVCQSSSARFHVRFQGTPMLKLKHPP